MKIILGIVIGAAIGFAAGYLGRCTGQGICPLVRNPWTSTLFGALFGFIIASGR